MKTVLEPEDLQAITKVVCDVLKPMLLQQKRKEPDDVIFDVQGLAAYLHVSKQWVYERTHLKEIPHIKKQGLLRFRKRDIDRWLDSTAIPAIHATGIPSGVTKRGR